MSIKFEDMEGRPRKLYEVMWKDFDFGKFGAEIGRTYSTRYQKESDNSYRFIGELDKEQLLSKVFGIENEGLFSKKYKMATSGSGEEERKITTLHSSSLCALLHFYNVTEDNPLTLKFVTDKNERRVQFTQSFFEYKSPVINNPSNMDVVLFGNDKDHSQDVVLLLESKFSEYYLGASSVLHDVSSQYCENIYSAPLYRDDVLRDIGLKRKAECDGYFKLESLDGQFYIGGIKQMISHYTGVMNVMNNHIYGDEKKEKSEVQEKVDNAISNKDTVVILGEIVFDRIIGGLELRPKILCGSAYSDKYRKLELKIEDLTKGNDRFEIIKDELGYSLFATNKHKIEQKIRDFYRY